MRKALAAVLVLSGTALLAWVLLSPRLEDARTARAQADLLGQVPDAAAAVAGTGSGGADEGGDLSAGPPTARPVAVGEAAVVLQVPRWGEDWRWTAVEGTTPDLLEVGPGHYEGTAWPGERGNAAFAAHRAGHGDPFLDFDQLQPGDEVVLSQGDLRWVYAISSPPRIVPESAAWVLDPLPGRQLTLTTCWPRYGSEKRMYVRAELTAVQQRHGQDWQSVYVDAA